MSFTEKLKKMINPVTQKPFVEEQEIDKDFDTVLAEEENTVQEPMEQSERAPEPKYEYEVLLKDNAIFEHGSWVPIETSMIKRPENINKYIQHGILRKINR